MEENRLFMPQGLKTEKEWYEGFGRRELMQLIYGSIGVVIITVLLYLITGQMSYVVIALLFGESSVFMLVIRSPESNLSALSHIMNALRYWQEQQHYTFKQMKE